MCDIKKNSTHKKEQEPPEQEAMFKVLAAGRKIGKPLLLYLVDAYTRCRIEAHENKQKPPTIKEWVTKDPHIQAMTNGIESNQETVKAAMETFYSRFNSKITFQNFGPKIDDLLEVFAEYIDQTIFLIDKMLNPAIGVKPALPPFQVILIF